MSVAESEFRRALGSWASGVTVVTASTAGVDHGMTVSSFTSVSLVPPLVSVCLDLGTRTLELVQISGAFAVNVLAADQAADSNHFASRATEDRRLEGRSFTRGGNGCALLDGALVHLECDVFGIHAAGDHLIVVGRVSRVSVRDAEPLMYFRGAYGSFSRS